MVVPPSTLAAKPVEAVTKVEPGGSARRMCFSSSDLPVPACMHDRSDTQEDRFLRLMQQVLNLCTLKALCTCAAGEKDALAGTDSICNALLLCGQRR